MNDRNLDRLLDAWLDLGPAAARDRVTVKVTARVPALPSVTVASPTDSVGAGGGGAASSSS